jgi:hypothetical protein
MKNLLIPFLLFGYVLTTAILSAFAFMTVDKAYDPESFLLWLVAVIIVNILCFVYSMIWYHDIIEESK